MQEADDKEVKERGAAVGKSFNIQWKKYEKIMQSLFERNRKWLLFINQFIPVNFKGRITSFLPSTNEGELQRINLAITSILSRLFIVAPLNDDSLLI